jgi:hypothetical protein
MLGPNDPSAREAARRRDALDARIPRVTFTSQTPLPKTLEIWIDGTDVSARAAKGAVELDPGRHGIVVRGYGPNDRRYSIALQESARPTIRIDEEDGVQQQQAPAPPQTTAPAPTVVVQPKVLVTDPADSTAGTSPVGDVILVTGGVLEVIGAGALIGGLATSAMIFGNHQDIQDQCNDYECTHEGMELVHENERLLRANSICWAVGGTSMLVGLVFVAVGAGISPTVADVVGLAPTDGGAVVSVRGEF